MGVEKKIKVASVAVSRESGVPTQGSPSGLVDPPKWRPTPLIVEIHNVLVPPIPPPGPAEAKKWSPPEFLKNADEGSTWTGVIATIGILTVLAILGVTLWAQGAFTSEDSSSDRGASRECSLGID